MKKNTIALGGLFACLHVLFLFISRFVVGSELLLVLFLPLLSTIYTLKSDRKHVLIFFIATVFVCMLFDFIGSFIYIIPSLICGIVYGFLRKCKFRELELLCISGITHMFSISFSFMIIVFLFKEVSFMQIFQSIFSLDDKKLYLITLLVLFVLGFCESFLVHVVTDNELKKVSFGVEKNDVVPRWFAIVSVFSFISYIVISFFDSLLGVVPFFVFVVFFVPYIVSGIVNFKYKFLTVLLISLFSFISVFLVKYLSAINYLILPLFVLSPLVINNFGDNQMKKLLKE